MEDRLLDLVNEIYNLFNVIRSDQPECREGVKTIIEKIDLIWNKIKKEISKTCA